ncbi:MAG TPA: hypothetical protein PKC43_10355 [Phycisphaerales bacterium]|nr:hypothetical protein [Phycisphaerales bacterium]HMP37838.1 hypothetical protein [Phycisphaerales bacterium]
MRILDGDGRQPRVVARLPDGARFERAAMGWSYILANRARWVGDEEARRAQAERMRRELSTLLDGAPEDGESGAARRGIAALSEAIGSTALIEVSIPFAGEEVGWAARIFPWEYALSAVDAAADRRGPEEPLTVVRHLCVPSGAAAGRTSARAEPSLFPALFVAEAPGRLDRHIALDVKRDLVWASLGCPEPDRFRPLSNPTTDQLRRAIRDLSPQLIHVAGFDLHQGAAILGERAAPSSRDGIFVAGADHRPATLDHVNLASTLCAAPRPPRLIGFGFQRSASRIAPMSVAAGCGAAVGFHGHIDDRLADLFFSTLYGAGHHRPPDILRAFIEARTGLGRQPREHRGTGVVLWGRESWLKADESERPEERTAASGVRDGARATRASRETPAASEAMALRGANGELPTDAATMSRGDGDATARTAGRHPASLSAASEPPVLVHIDVPERLNYAMLHNNRPILRRFIVVNTSGAPVDRLVVDVSLHVGGDSFPFRRMLWRLEGAPLELERDVRLPLLSPLWRQAREAIRTTLVIRVSCAGRDGEQCEAFLDTRQLTLLPPDEWRDDDENRAWLPSFVLSRDPAVAAILRSAQQILVALADDPSAGFDGGQSTLATARESERDAPSGAAPTDCPVESPVDRQVRAIWHALIGAHGLAYVTPPPTFSERSQRLRRPSEILGGGRGTCIDLALLLAACLESVDIHPVLWLLHGHALTGYWRSEAARRRFARVVPPPAVLAGTPSTQIAGGEDEEGFSWMLDRDAHAELLGAIAAGDLVALEAEALTRRSSFAAAVREGAQRVAVRDAFEYFVDVRAARLADVTPLPLEG